MRFKDIIKIVLCLIVLLVVYKSNFWNDTKYMTVGEWAMYDTNYMFAVEVDDFDGDVFSAGIYNFSLVAGRTEPSTNGSLSVSPAIFDVYISDKVYSSFANMKREIPEPQISVGGMGPVGTAIEYELLAGQYVYIVPYSNVVYQPSGYLKFEIIE